MPPENANGRVSSLFSVIYPIRAIVLGEIKQHQRKRAHKQRYTDLDISVKESTLSLSFHMCLADVCRVVVPNGERGASALSVIVPVAVVVCVFFGRKAPSVRLPSTAATQRDLDDYLLSAG